MSTRHHLLALLVVAGGALPLYAHSDFVVVRGERAIHLYEGGVAEHTRDTGIVRRHAGPQDPVALAVSDDGARIVVASRSGDLITIDDSGSRSVSTGAAITEIVLAGDQIWALDGYSGRLLAVRGERVRDIATLGPDATAMRADGNAIYVAARGSRQVVRVDLAGETLTRSATLPGAVSDLEIGHSSIYLTLPELGEIIILDSATLEQKERFRIGSAPTDLAIGDAGNLVDAGRIWIADPVLGAFIRDERTQTMGRAVTRGFLRGLLGLGLDGAELRRVNGRPARVIATAGNVAGQDIATGRVWVVRDRQVQPLGLAPDGAFALDPESGSVVWIDRSTSQLRWAERQRSR